MLPAKSAKGLYKPYDPNDPSKGGEYIITDEDGHENRFVVDPDTGRVTLVEVWRDLPPDGTFCEVMNLTVAVIAAAETTGGGEVTPEGAFR